MGPFSFMIGATNKKEWAHVYFEHIMPITLNRPI